MMTDYKSIVRFKDGKKGQFAISNAVSIEDALATLKRDLVDMRVGLVLVPSVAEDIEPEAA